MLLTLLPIVLGSALAAPAPEVPERRGPNFKAAEAAKWLKANEDQFVLSLSGGAGKLAPTILVFTTNKQYQADLPAGTAFSITPDEAAALVQVLVDTGMWGRSDTLPPGPLMPGRYLNVGTHGNGTPSSWIWMLGGYEDDVSSMYLIRHLLETSKGERLKVLKEWLKPWSPPKERDK